MKVQGKEVLKTLFTFGIHGYVNSKKMFEETGLKKRIALSEVILGFMLAIPIICAVDFAISLLSGITALPYFANELKVWWEFEAIGTGPPIIEALLSIHAGYFFFILMHLYLSIAYIQHSNLKDWNQIWRVLIFGFYALEWDPLEHLDANESGEP